jgi:hypothetical protein
MCGRLQPACRSGLSQAAGGLGYRCFARRSDAVAQCPVARGWAARLRRLLICREDPAVLRCGESAAGEQRGLTYASRRSRVDASDS